MSPLPPPRVVLRNPTWARRSPQARASQRALAEAMVRFLGADHVAEILQHTGRLAVVPTPDAGSARIPAPIPQD